MGNLTDSSLVPLGELLDFEVDSSDAPFFNAPGNLTDSSLNPLAGFEDLLIDVSLAPSESVTPPIDIDCPTSGQDALSQRLREILGQMVIQYPDLYGTVDIWRESIIQSAEFSDSDISAWIRVAENVPAFVLEKQERWGQKGIGVFTETVKYAIVPQSIQVQSGDIIIWQAESYMVSDAPSGAGISKLKLELPKSRFIAPARSEPTIRQMGMRARIR